MDSNCGYYRPDRHTINPIINSDTFIKPPVSCNIMENLELNNIIKVIMWFGIGYTGAFLLFLAATILLVSYPW